MKKGFILAGLIFASLAIMADTVEPFDSAALHEKIVDTANVIIAAVPDVNPGVSMLKVALISVGSAITGWCIHYFKKRNEKK